MGNAPSSGNASTSRFLAGCPEIPSTPAADAVLAQFEELLRAKEIPELVANELAVVETLDTKWMYVFLCTPDSWDPTYHRSKLPAESVDKDWLEPRECVLQVMDVQQRAESVQQLFCAIRINIVLRSREWVDKFISADGVGALVTLLQSNTSTSISSTMAPSNPVIHEEVLSVLFTLAAFSDGVDEIAEANGCCTGLLMVLEYTTSSALRVRTLKLLGFMCSHSKSTQEIVLSAITSMSSPEERPFRSICQQFTASPQDSELQTAVILFLDALLGSISNPAHRTAIRDDLGHHGLISALEAHHQVKASDQGLARLGSAVELFMKAHRSDASTKEDEQASASGSTEQDGQVVESNSSVPDETTKWSVTITLEALSSSDDVDQQPEARNDPSSEKTQAKEDPSSVGDAMSVPEPANSRDLKTPSDCNECSEVVSNNQAEDAEKEYIATSGDSISPTAPTTEQDTGHSTQPDPQSATSQQSTTMLQSLVNQLESQQLDDATSEKITRVLQALVESLSTEKAKGIEAVDRLEKSLFARSNQHEARSEATMMVSPSSEASESASDPIQRVRMRLLSGFGDQISSVATAGSPRKSSVTKASSLFQSFENFFSGSGAPTPSKPSANAQEPCEPGGDVAGSPFSDKDESESSTHAIPKLTLPFFQSFRKGPGLGVTPASTPIATASVRKDAKRHSFAAFTSSSMSSTSESGLTSSSNGVSVLPTLSLTPLLPAIVKPVLNVPSRLEQVSDEAAPAAPGTGTDVSKFRKLLSMGAPKEAVRAKMRQAGLDPDLLDEKQAFDVPATPPPSTPVASAAFPAVEPSAAVASTGPDISKFRKLLSMGAPLAAVKAKMVQAGLDPELLGQKAGFTEPHVAPAPTAAATASASDSKLEEEVDTASQGPDISKFKKLLTMGAPLAAVKAKMMQTGLDPALLDEAAPSAPPAPPATASTVPVAAKVLVKDDPEYVKFFKLQSMGAPAEAVKAKMRQAGLNCDLLDTPDAVLPGKEDAVQVATAKKPQVLVKDDSDYAKFFKLLSMGAPAPTVKAKMQMAGLKPELLDTPDAVIAGPEEEANAQATPQVLVKDDPEYAKFFKLLSMGAPAPTVKAKMQMAGLKPELLDTPDTVLNAPAVVNQKPLVLVKDDPEYAKFFKLLTMGAPAEMVKAKMQMAGLKPELLDTPDAVLTPAMGGAQAGGGTAANAKPANNAARRAHLAISIKPPVKQATRSFYWQQLKGEAIKGTIWEEIEKESSSDQSNQAPPPLILLSEGELAVLEAEFPPPQAANGPGTGTRGRTNSIDHTAKDPGSPIGSPRVVFLIDRGRANNISIIIKQFRMSNAALREAIMKLDANVLTIERVQGLLKIMPTEEEIAAITGFQGDPLTLNEAERILKELISVPRLKQRLSALQAKLQFPTLVRDLQTKVTKIRTASMEISQSSEFKATLLVVLQVGNKMNQGTNRGDAKGFRLGDLTKLAQLKSVDKAVTLLHFVARMIRLKKSNLVRLGDALSSLYDVQNIPIPELQADMFKITEVVDNIGNELSAQKLKNSIEEKESCDLFVKVMDEFMDTASTTTAILKEELNSTMQLLRDTMKRFDKDTDADEATPESSGPPSAASMAGACEFFSIVYEFSVALMKADRENELRRLKEERQLKLQQQKSQLPTRSHSSVDLLSGLPRSKSVRGEISRGDGAAGPETPERSLSKKDSGNAKVLGKSSSFGMSPVTRSVSMSAILELKTGAEPGTPSATPAATPASSTTTSSKTPERPMAAAAADKSKIKKPIPSAGDSSPTAKPPARAGKRTEELSTTKTATKSVTKEKDKPKGKEKPKSKAKTMMTVPGKIIKATKHSSNIISPLKISPSIGIQAASSPAANSENGSGGGALSSLKKIANSSIEKSKRRASSGERIVPFDESTSLEDIRNKIQHKHSSPGTRHSYSKPETVSETEDGYENNNSTPASPEKDEIEVETSLALDGVVSLQAVFCCCGEAVSVSADGYVATYVDVERVFAASYSERHSFLCDMLGAIEQRRSTAQRQSRRLTTSGSTLTSFRAVQKKGMRGFLEGGTFLNSSPARCAMQCAADALCLSFDFETVTLACYVSHTDRYAHPEAFLDFPTGVYYEWQGVIASPELEPNGGLYSTQIAARLFTDKLGAVIYYRVEALAVESTLMVTEIGLFGPTQTFGVVSNGDLIILPPYSCKIYAMAVKDGMTSSPILVSNEYSIYASKYAFLVPYFNGQFHGHVARLKLDVKGKKRPRPARFLEFSDYESDMGIGPYSGQVSVVNLTTLNPDFKGFYGGLTGFAKTAFLNETYSIPAPDDPNYVALKWRLVFEPQYTPHPSHVGFGEPKNVLQDSEYLYLAPFYNGVSYLGTVVRILALTFSDTPFIQQLNLTNINANLKGFGSSFADAEFAYFIPRENENGLFGKMVRISMDDFTPTGVTVLDLAVIDPRFVGFASAYTYKNYAYLVPMLKPLTSEEQTTNLREFPVSNSGLLVRVNLQSFATADALDLTTFHPDLVGFSGAVRVANYAYLVPYMRRRVPSPVELNPYSSLVARVDLRDFASVSYIDLAEVDDGLRGFVRGFAYRQFVIFVPSRSKYYSPGTKAQSGKVARLDTTKFSSEGVTFLDLATAYRSQVPDRPDDSLRGFSGGFVSGKYGFFVPFFDGGLFSGKMCRINLEKFNEVQVLDLTALDQDLRGFSGGILSRTQEMLDTDLFGEFQMRQGTTTPYEYIY